MISIGWLIGTIISAILILASAIVGLLSWMTPRETVGRNNYSEPDNDLLWATRIISTVVLLATVGVYFGTTWPTFDMQYHTYKPVSGTVTAIGTRLLGSDKSTNQEFVVTINGQDYRCDDTRCALTKVGDTLSLRCIRDWQYAGTSGWDCNYVSETP